MLFLHGLLAAVITGGVTAIADQIHSGAKFDPMHFGQVAAYGAAYGGCLYVLGHLKGQQFAENEANRKANEEPGN